MDTLTGKRILILGLARQGLALARFACGMGAEVIVSDLRPAEQLAAETAALDGLPIAFVFGSHPDSLLAGTDVVALSGSVPVHAPIVQAAQAQNIPLTNDSLEFVRRCPAPTVGITGSAGKTTTTTLVGEMCQTAGLTTYIGGNIGQPLISDLSEIQADDTVIQELSSFQLELWDQSPEIAAVLNITPNHLDRHKTMVAYSGAKANILRYQTAADSAILCADDMGSMNLAPLVNGRLRTFGLESVVDDGAFVRNGEILLRDGTHETAVCAVNATSLRGQHNRLNIVGACAIADTIGVPAGGMAETIATFAGVEHRLELVRTIKGVQYVNDSIATAPERALAALAAFDEPLILLAGGRDKKMEWDDWTNIVIERTKSVILFGALAEMLEERLLSARDGVGKPAVVRVETVHQAVETAAQIAQSGDIVLLSPGGTSYDAFKDFVERGELFRAVVNNL